MSGASRQVDRLLRDAGHTRHDRRTGLTKYSVGYMVDQQSVSVDGSVAFAVLVSWDGGHDRDPGHAREALAPLAETLSAAGFAVRRADLAPGGYEDLAWPSLIVLPAAGIPAGGPAG